MGHADAVMISIGRDEYLGFMAKATKRNGMDDPVAITLINITRPPNFLGRFAV
jgi:hypothetical protein